MDPKRRITHEVLHSHIIRQQNWTVDQLRAMGYEYYDRIKEVTMARTVLPSEAPLTVVTAQGDQLIADAGYVICYSPGNRLRRNRDDYEHWPVAPEIFKRSYRPWDEDWNPSPTEAHLEKLGCRPFYKATGIWAKKLDTDVYLQSLEHMEPVKISTGQYVAIGIDGEPYSMGEQTIHSRYKRPQKNTVMRVLRRILRL